MSLTGFSQDAEPAEETKEGWTKTGLFTLMINQAAFSNWQAGGDNSFAGNISINYDVNYVKGVWLWDNKIIASYGLTNNDDDGKGSRFVVTCSGYIAPFF